MAIELHHLHPGHDDELPRLKARIAELEALNHDLCERVTENDEIRLHWEEIEQTRAENERMKARIAELEEERRWRKFSEEMPKLQEGVSEIFLVVVENESNTSPKGSYVTIAELCDGEWYNDVTGNEIEENIEGSDYFYRSKVTHWMPLPKAPEEDK